MLRLRVYQPLLGFSARSLGTTSRYLNPYATLGISVNASKKEIKAAYRKKVKDCHPGKHFQFIELIRKSQTF